MNNTISLQQIGSGERRLFVDLETPDAAVVPSLISDQENQLQRTRFGSVGSKLLLATSGVVALEMTAGTLFDNSQVYAQEAPIPNQDTESPPMSVFFTGDSLTEGRVIYGDLEKKLTEAGIQVFEVQYKSGIPVSKGTEYLRQHPEEVGNATTVVLALGTNDSNVVSFKQDLLEAGRVAQQIGVAPDGVAPIIVIPDIFGNSSRIQADSKNNGIDEVVAQLSSEGIRVVNLPYKEYIDNVVRPAGAVAGDEIHLTGDGYDLLTDYDASRIKTLTNDYYDELHPQPIPPIEHQAVPEIIDNTVLTHKVADIDIISPETIRNIEAGDSGQPMAGIRRALPNDFSITPIGQIKPKVNFDYTNEDSIGVITTVQPELVDLVEIPVISDQQTTNESSQIPKYETGAQLAGPAVISLPSLQSLNPSEKTPEVVLADIAAKIHEPKGEIQQSINANSEMQNNDLSQFGIFYDENGRPFTQIDRFYKDGNLEITEGYADPRDVGNGTYRQGNFDSSTGKTKSALYSPLPGIVHINKTSGEGNKVTVELGLSDRTGKPYMWFATHLSSTNVKEGEIVLPGQLIGYSGDTGVAFGNHNSTGLTDQQTVSELNEYANSNEALNPFDYMHPDVAYECRQSAFDDFGELCGPTYPGQLLSLPVHPAVVAYLLSSDIVQLQPVTVTEQSNNDVADIGIESRGDEYTPDVTDTTISITKQAIVDFEITNTSQVVIPNVEPATGNVNNIIKKQNNRSANNGVIADPISSGADNNGVSPQNNASIDSDTTKPLDLPNVEEGVNISNGVGVDENGEVIVDISKLPETADSNLSQTEDSVLVSETENVTIASDDEPEPVQDPQPVESQVGEPEPELIPQETEPTPEPIVDPNDATLGAVPQEIYDTLRGPDFGYTHAGAIGWMANFALESGLNPTRTQISWNGNCAPAPERLNPEKKGAPEGTKGQGFGLGQWTLKERQQELQKVADNAGVPWTNLQLQLGHARNEAEYYGINNELRSTEDITAATILVLAKFENPQAYIDGGSAREGVINERVNRALELNDQISRGDFASIDVACD